LFLLKDSKGIDMDNKETCHILLTNRRDNVHEETGNVLGWPERMGSMLMIPDSFGKETFIRLAAEDVLIAISPEPSAPKVVNEDLLVSPEGSLRLRVYSGGVSVFDEVVNGADPVEQLAEGPVINTTLADGREVTVYFGDHVRVRLDPVKFE
jgi:hypothetical protein